MHFPTITTLSTLLLSTTVLGLAIRNDDSNHDLNIFPSNPDAAYSSLAICKNSITHHKFPHLQGPSGCVRYFRGIDMTGVVTEVDLFARDGIHSACDCAARCLSSPTTCTNWVFKHAFKNGDGGKRSCTLYSSPNLPTDVTLKYDLAGSKGFQTLDPGNNPQAGGDAPLTFLDQAGTKVDKFGVSGVVFRDTNGNLYC
jgi:hypothetical protein